MSEEVSLTLCDRMSCRYALAASRAGSAGADVSSTFATLAPVVAGTTPALTKALNKFAISGTAGAVDVDGIDAPADANRRERSIGSALGCSNDVGYDCWGGYAGAAAAGPGGPGGAEYDCGAGYDWGVGAGGGDDEAGGVVRVRN